VLVGIVTGCVLGIVAPTTAVTLKPLSDESTQLRLISVANRLPLFDERPYRSEAILQDSKSAF